MPNPYNPDELKRQAQVQQLGRPDPKLVKAQQGKQFDQYGRPVSADPYASTRPAASPSWGDAEWRQYYKDPNVRSTYRDSKQKPDLAAKAATTAVLSLFGASAAGAGMGAAGASGGSGGAALPNGIGGLPVGMGVGGSTIGTAGVTAPVVAGGATASSGLPWGKIAKAGGSIYSAVDALRADGTPERPPASDTMPIGSTPNPVSTITDGTNSGVVTPKATNLASTVAPVAGPPPPGWDAKNWADPNMHTVKYDAGRLLYGATKPSDVARIVGSPAFQARFPGATFDGKDKIDFKGALSEGTTGSPVGLIDVLMAADQGSDTSTGIWWGSEPDGESGNGSASTSGTRPTGSGMPFLSSASDNSTLARIMAELQATSKGTLSPELRAAILGQL